MAINIKSDQKLSTNNERRWGRSIGARFGVLNIKAGIDVSARDVDTFARSADRTSRWAEWQEKSLNNARTHTQTHSQETERERERRVGVGWTVVRVGDTYIAGCQSVSGTGQKRTLSSRRMACALSWKNVPKGLELASSLKVALALSTITSIFTLDRLPFPFLSLYIYYVYIYSIKTSILLGLTAILHRLAIVRRTAISMSYLCLRGTFALLNVGFG